MKSKYAFLTDHFPALAGMGSLAEDYLYTDGNSCLIKLWAPRVSRNFKNMQPSAAASRFMTPIGWL
jgi:hypothetical protein